MTGGSLEMFVLAGLRYQQGQTAEAAALFRRVLEREPEHAAAWFNIGMCYRALRDFANAALCFERAIVLHPTSDAACFSLGLALQELQRPTDALRCYERAIELRPDNAQAHNNRGSLLAALNRLDEALECFDRALALNPDYARAHSNRGAALTVLNRPDEALESCDRALALTPTDAESHNNRGNALSRLGRFDEALSSYQRAWALAPEYASAHWNHSLTELRLGRFSTGWARHEYRWKRSKAAPQYRHGSVPPWRGAEPLAGKRLLVWAEQGYGDTVQFCRYVPMLAALGAQVVLEVPRPMTALLGTLGGVAQLCGQGEPVGDCDYEVPLLSLPLAFGTELPTIPAPVPYLRADPEHAARWRSRLGQPDGMPRIGVAASGNREHENDRNRSMPLDRFATLYDKAHLYLLQKDVRAEDEDELRDGPVRDLRAELSDFTDTAALIECLDLVISVDTVVVHLAAAMGKPVWVLLSAVSDWRWMLDRADSPWYPSARLFRQRRLGDWTEVIDRVAGELAAFTGGAPPR